MDRKHAIDYIANKSWRESRLGLERIEELLRRMGSPHEKLTFIHVAGTNGKGSVCSMVGSVLSAAGYVTGTFTSPFVNRFNERMQVDGTTITDGELADLTERVRVFADEMDDHPTEFELVTAIGFLFFAEKGCDVVVLEVGLGGRLDATNVIPPPMLAIITSIGFDHMAELGHTLEEIAGEKAGIIKQGTTVVLAPQPPNVQAVFEAVCLKEAAQLYLVDETRIQAGQSSILGQEVCWDGTLELSVPLAGVFQLQNTATALTALEVLRQQKGYQIPKKAVYAGFQKVRWPARLELLEKDPVFLLDGGHNLPAVEALSQSLSTYLPGQGWVLLTGVMADKDWESMLRRMQPLAKHWVCVAPDNPRALSAEELAGWLSQHGEAPAEVCANVKEGVNQALMLAKKEGLPVCAFGSLYMAGEIRSQFGLGLAYEKEIL